MKISKINNGLQILGNTLSVQLFNNTNTSYNFKLFQIFLQQTNNWQSMADIIKVKPKKIFEWQQDTKYLYVKIPMPGHTTIKHLQIFASDLIVRVTSKIKKSTETLDLLHEIDYLSPDNKFVLIDSTLNATLRKADSQVWPTLTIEDISLADLKNRRNQSQARYEANIKQIEQTKGKLKTEYDRKATQEMMRFQENERNQLNLKKEQERDQALAQVFKNVNEKTGKIMKQDARQQTNWKQKQMKVLEQFDREEERQRQMLKQQSIRSHEQRLKRNNMFNEGDISYHENLRSGVHQTEQIEEIPVRRQAKIDMKFTEKLYPHVATRDYHYTEPPMPKGQLPMAPSRDGELENRNPLWLKDRGDQFAKNKNYEAALQVYNEALKIDGRNRKILMNRSLAHMKLLNLESCINDCEDLLQLMQKQLVNSQESKQQCLQNVLKIKSRKALCLAMKGSLPQSRVLLTQLLSFELSAEQASQLQSCLELVTKREASLLEKCKGDELVKRNAYSEAVAYYDRAIGIDRNEYALSNKSLCLNKLSRFEDSITVCEEGIKLVEDQIATASQANKSSSHYNSILMKLLYRKATAQEAQKLLKQSEQTLKKALLVNPTDKDILSALSNLTQRKQALEFAGLKQQASLQLQQNKPGEALELYHRCLKLCESKDRLQDYLSIQQNQCVCYLKMQDYDSLVAVCIRIINTVTNLQKKVVEFTQKNKTDSALTKDTTDKILVRTLVRRANGYVNLGQVYNAKADLQKALKIAPHDQGVKVEYEKLMKSLAAT